MSQDSEIALLCLIHPESAEKRKRILDLLPSCYNYRDPAAQTTTWSYFLPSSRPGAPSQMITKLMSSSPATALAGFEVYAAKAALQRQLEHPNFKRYHELAKKESLYQNDEELVAWYRRGGFWARGDGTRAGKGVIVVTAIFVLKDNGNTEEGVKILSDFCEWVKQNEPGTLTYTVLSRPKAPKELLMFERYEGLDAFKKHGGSKEFRAMFKKMRPLTADTLINEWEETDRAFVGNIAGGQSQERQSKM